MSFLPSVHGGLVLGTALLLSPAAGVWPSVVRSPTLHAQSGSNIDKTLSVDGRTHVSVEVVVPTALGAGRCVTYSSGKPTDTTSGTRLTFDCADPEALVRCDFDAAEPIDVAVGDVCRTGALPLTLARQVRIETGTPGAVTVEWLESTPAERGVRVTATRRLQPGRQATLMVADTRNRLVRFSRDGVSPVTVEASSLRPGPWQLPAPVPGGEIVVHTQPSPVTPGAYHVQGPEVREIAVEAELVAARGRRPGAYTVMPVYEGGLTGRARRLAIEAEHSTFAYMSPEPVGAVEIVGSASICAAGAWLRLVREGHADADSGTVATRERVLRAPVTADCRWMVAGLRPGAYDVRVESSSDVLAGAAFAIEAQRQTGAQLQADAMSHVSGRVELNGKAASGVIVSFEQLGKADVRVNALVEADGSYRAALSEPGSYTVSFRRGDAIMLGNEHELRVPAGDTHKDWSLEGMRLRVHVEGWDRASPVDVRAHLRILTKPGHPWTAERLMPEDEPVVEMDGLAPGTYLVDARQRVDGGDDKAAGVQVVLDADNPEAAVTLALGTEAPRLFVQRMDGTPAIGARVLAGGTSIAPEAPGVFHLTDVTIGSRLVIAAPGMGTTCGIAMPSDSTAVLRPGASVSLRFTRGRLRRPGGLLAVPDTGCLLPLAELGYRPLTRDADDSTTFLVEGLPSGAFVYMPNQFAPPDLWQQVFFEDGGSVTLTVPE